MAAGQQFAADFGVGLKAAAGQVFEFDGAFVVVELADEVLAAADMGPAQERIGLQLHGALALGDALAVVGCGVGVGQIGRVAGGRLFLDLKKERVGRAVALEVNAVVAQAHGACAHHFEGYVYGAIEGQKMLALGFEHLAVRLERGQHGSGLRAGDAGEYGLVFLEAAERAGLARTSLSADELAR